MFDLLSAAKRVTASCGLYRQARLFDRHVLHRQRLHEHRSDLRFFSQFVSPGSLCFDVGANVGNKTEAFLALGATVVAFEPQLECLQELRARLGHSPNLTTLHTAIGSRQGQLPMYVSKARTASSLVPDWSSERVGEITVPVNTLDAAIAFHGVPHFCKIDVEGYELEIFKGLSQRIPTIMFEFSTKGAGVTRAIECLRLLSRFGSLSLNAVQAEGTEFLGKQWWALEEFIAVLTDTFSVHPNFDWADIVVRTGSR